MISLETALKSPNMPDDILQMLLNLVEFMEHDDNALRMIDIRILSKLALKCHAYAKALHYKEMEFKVVPQRCIEHLISINNNLEQPEAAMGAVEYARQNNFELAIEVSPMWYERLGKWQEALLAYNQKSQHLLTALDDELAAADAAAKEKENVSINSNTARDVHVETGHKRPGTSPTSELVWNTALEHGLSKDIISVTLGRLRCHQVFGYLVLCTYTLFLFTEACHETIRHWETGTRWQSWLRKSFFSWRKSTVN